MRTPSRKQPLTSEAARSPPGAAASLRLIQPTMKKDRPRRGGYSTPVPKADYRLLWWCLAIGLTAVAISITVILKS